MRTVSNGGSKLREGAEVLDGGPAPIVTSQMAFLVGAGVPKPSSEMGGVGVGAVEAEITAPPRSCAPPAAPNPNGMYQLGKSLVKLSSQHWESPDDILGIDGFYSVEFINQN